MNKPGTNTFEINLDSKYIMGILNVTPDSFSDGGKFFSKDKAVDHALEMIEAGADIIDIGGETTRPGSELISFEEEIKRVIPVVEEILRIKPDTIISVDTNKHQTAEASLISGASIINDISGGTFDEAIFDVCAKYNPYLILMHIKGIPKFMQQNTEYNNLIEDIYSFLYNQVIKAKEKGINKIIIDPGIGFGKDIKQNLEIIRKIPYFKKMGYPVLIGLSRKSFIGKLFNLEVNERDFETSIYETISFANGCNIIRTHNINNAIKVKNVCNSIFGK